MNISIRSTRTMRYFTLGDWVISPTGYISIEVSEEMTEKTQLLVAVHELVEAILCRARGITTAQVDDWDVGPGLELDEPGDHPDAPYHREHKFAMIIESLLEHEIGV